MYTCPENLEVKFLKDALNKLIFEYDKNREASHRPRCHKYLNYSVVQITFNILNTMLN